MRNVRAVASMMVLFALAAPAALASGTETPAGIAMQNNLALDPLTVTVFRDNRARGLLAVELSLELAKSDDRDRIEKIMPRLRDRYVTALTRFAANRVDINRTIDIQTLAQMLQGATNDVLGQSAATILIGGAIVRRL